MMLVRPAGDQTEDAFQKYVPQGVEMVLTLPCVNLKSPLLFTSYLSVADK